MGFPSSPTAGTVWPRLSYTQYLAFVGMAALSAARRLAFSAFAWGVSAEMHPERTTIAATKTPTHATSFMAATTWHEAISFVLAVSFGSRNAIRSGFHQ